MIKKFFPIVWVALFTSCASTPRSAAELDVNSSEAAVEKPIQAEKPADTVKNEPASTLSPDLLYLLLSAEIAGQRGELDIALDYYLKAARRSGDPQVAERAAQVALFVDDSEKALEALKIWVVADPDSHAARSALAAVYLKKGDRRQALQQIKAFLVLQESNFEEAVFAVARLLAKEAPHDAMPIMEALVEAFPDKAEVHYVYGSLALNNDDPDLALKAVRRALALRPGWGRALVLDAQIAMRNGDQEAARAIFLNAMKKAPSDVQLRMVYAQYLIKQGDYTAAEQEFKRIVEEYPENYDAQFAFALVQMHQHKYASARRVLMKLTGTPKWRDQAFLYLGRLEGEEKNVKESLRWYDQVVDGPYALEAGLNAVSVAAKYDRVSEANKRLASLRNRFPNESVRLYLIEAEIWSAQKDYQNAFRVLTRALAEMPGQTELLYTRALMAERLDRLDVLEEDLKAILAEDPDDVNALNALGYTLADRTTRYEESRRYLERAIELQPDDPVIMDSYGWLQYRLGNYQQALSYLQRAYGLNQDPEIAAHLGEVLWMMGQQAKAKSIWQQVLEKEPRNEYIRGVKIRLMGQSDD